MPRLDFLQFVDHLVVNGSRIFGWGWAAHRSLEVERVSVRVRGTTWERMLVCSSGLARPDVGERQPELLGATSCGYVVTGFLPDPDVRSLTLVVDFEDGLFREVDITPSLRRLGAQGSRLQLASRLARGAWRRLRRMDLRGLVARAAQPQAYAPPSFDDPRGAERAAFLLAGRDTCIVFDNSLGGGSNQYRRTLIAERVANGQGVVLCTYLLAVLEYRLHVFTPGEEVVFRVSGPMALEKLFSIARVVEVFLNSPVSFDDPAGLAAWVAQLKRRDPQLRLTVTAHDFLPVCPSFVLLDADRAFCGIPDAASCDRCLSRNAGGYVALSPPSRIGPWRAAWGECLMAADEVRFFSQSSRKLLLRAYPGLPQAKATVVPHDMEYFQSAFPRLDRNGPLVIGIVGEITLQKGALIVRDLVALIEARKEDLRVVVMGDLNLARKSPRLTVTGAYMRGELVELIEKHGVNMFLFPSIWPETFSYVVGELTRMRVPIVAFDLGAPAERLRTYAHARLCPEVSAEAALDTAIAFHRDLAEASAA